MATQVSLKAGRREPKGKGGARKLRALGDVPAVLYGAGAEPVSIRLNAHEAELLFRSISVDNTLINLEVEGEKAPVVTLVREIQTHPARAELLHVDFYRVQMDVEVELEVPLHLDGTAAGVKEGGVVDQPIHDLPVRCLPSDIPEAIHVDVSNLNIGDLLRVKDLVVPKGVTILLDGERTVCSVQVPTKLEEVVAPDTTQAEPEVISEAGAEGEEVEAEPEVKGKGKGEG
jgi:large subunit ribosomal protein L25